MTNEFLSLIAAGGLGGDCPNGRCPKLLPAVPQVAQVQAVQPAPMPVSPAPAVIPRAMPAPAVVPAWVPQAGKPRLVRCPIRLFRR